MGAVTNVQDRLIALHDLDAPWRPRDLIQISGRIVRRGNQNEKVYIFRYVTNGTFYSYLWQTLENKQKFISQIMTSKSPVRSCEDVDESVLSFAEVKALCAGDPRIKERMDLGLEVSKLKIMKADHNNRQYRLEDDLGEDPRGNITRIDNALGKIPESLEKYKADLENLLQQQEAAMTEAGKPFEHEEDLRIKSARLAELDAELNLSGRAQETA